MDPILKKADIALIVLLFIFACSFYFIFNGRGDPGLYVTVRVGGAAYERLSISEDAELEIRLADGRHSNTLEIKDGKAAMIHADCPDGLCLKHGQIERAGEIIACLPNRVIIEVSGADSEYDAVVR